MKYPLDFPKLESYSVALSEKLVNEFYDPSKSVITGPEILKFSPIEQLNLFIVKNLFDKWKEEMSRLRSPYFDFEDHEVKVAMSTFMNKLSKHISIRKEFFKPLVKKAVADTLSFILLPNEFVRAEYLSKPIIALNEIVEREKYIRINRFLLQSLIKKMQLGGKAGYAETEVNAFFDEVSKNYEVSLEEPNKYIEQFNVLLKLSLEDLLIKSAAQNEAVVTKEPEIVTRINTNHPLVQKANEVKANENKSSSTLNDLFQKNEQQKSINEMFQQNQPEIVIRTKKSKIHDLKTAVPLNLKYIFINELFKGAADDYHTAIQQIERCENYESALSILDQLYANQYQWDKEKAEVKEFYELVERRFY